MKRLMKHGGWFMLLLSGPTLIGCARMQAQPGQVTPPPPEVLASYPINREVTDYADFPGRIEAVNMVEIKARVTGYLDKMHFKEGTDVKKDDLLFEIDPRTYKAELARAEANLVLSEAHLKRLENDHQRAAALLAKGAMGREEFDKIAGDRAEASASVGVAKANRDLAELNLEFTKVRAPFSGRISRRFIDPGSLVKADETTLTTLASLHPIYAYFDVDEHTTLELQQMVRAGKIKWSPGAELPVKLGLVNQEGFPQEGKINFADNRIDADTGTWRLRGLFDNADQVLTPGLFVRMRAPLGDPYTATLVSEQALSTDQGKKFVYVIDDANKVSYRPVKVGRLHQGMRVITEGLSTGEKIVVNGLQRVRPGMEVNPKVVDMPGKK